jgi:hypothetical protein
MKSKKLFFNFRVVKHITHFLDQKPKSLFRSPQDFFFYSATIKTVQRFENYFFKKMSVEHFLQKILEVDKLLYVLLNKKELCLFKLLKNPSFLEENRTSEIEDYYNHYEYLSHSYLKNNRDTILAAIAETNPTFLTSKILDLSSNS